MNSVKINLSLDELLSIYHCFPRILIKAAKKVSVSEGSLRYSSQSPIVFTEAGNGNYLVINTNDVNQSWLLPRFGIIINTHAYETVKLVFDCQGYQPGFGSKFTVKKPAIVSLALNDQDWKLKEKGILEFNSTPSLESFQLKQAEEENQGLRSELSELDSQLTQVREEREQLLSRLTQLENENKKPENPTKQILLQLIKDYNNHSAYIPKHSIEVKERNDSSYRLFLGHLPFMVIANQNQGICWLININNNYYLVPKYDLVIAENELIIDALFILDNYESNSLQKFKFKLIKPAQLEKQGESWLLTEKGGLIFE